MREGCNDLNFLPLVFFGTGTRYNLIWWCKTTMRRLTRQCHEIFDLRFFAKLILVGPCMKRLKQFRELLFRFHEVIWLQSEYLRENENDFFYLRNGSKISWHCPFKASSLRPELWSWLQRSLSLSASLACEGVWDTRTPPPATPVNKRQLPLSYIIEL